MQWGRIENLRNQAMNSFTFASNPINLTDRNLNRISFILEGLETNGGTFEWELENGNHATVNATQMRNLKNNAFEHIRLSFANASTLATSVRNATTFAEVRDLDITQGWP